MPLGTFDIFLDFSRARVILTSHVAFCSYSAGDQLPAHTCSAADDSYVVVSGGSVTFTGQGRIYNGNIAFGGAANVDAGVFEPGCAAKQASPVDFVAAKEALVRKSAKVCKKAPTGTFTTESQKASLAFTGKKTEYVDFTCDQLANITDFGAPAGLKDNATMVFNVRGGPACAVKEMNMEALRPYAPMILWNFCEATTIDIHGVGVYGSILAPTADISNATGVVWGQVRNQIIKLVVMNRESILTYLARIKRFLLPP